MPQAPDRFQWEPEGPVFPGCQGCLSAPRGPVIIAWAWFSVFLVSPDCHHFRSAARPVRGAFQRRSHLYIRASDAEHKV
jgi:hypothetical protein